MTSNCNFFKMELYLFVRLAICDPTSFMILSQIIYFNVNQNLKKLMAKNLKKD